MALQPKTTERQTSVQRVGLWDQGAAALGRRGAHPDLQHRVMEFFPSPYRDALWKACAQAHRILSDCTLSLFSVNMPLEHVCWVTQSCPILYYPMVCSLPGSSVHGILQARILEWVAIPFSRGPSQSRNRTWVPFLSCRQIVYHLSSQGAPKPYRLD